MRGIAGCRGKLAERAQEREIDRQRDQPPGQDDRVPWVANAGLSRASEATADTTSHIRPDPAIQRSQSIPAANIPSIPIPTAATHPTPRIRGLAFHAVAITECRHIGKATGRGPGHELPRRTRRDHHVDPQAPHSRQ